jgi:hypothetical protein
MGVIKSKASNPKELAVEREVNFALEQKLRDLNHSFDTFRYFPVDDLTHAEEKLLHRIDLEITHRNPNITMEVSLDVAGRYVFQFSNGQINIEKACDTREKCFKKLKNFIETLKAIPVATKEEE